MEETRRICLISFSQNADHQNVIYSMFLALQGRADVWTIGADHPKSAIAPRSPRNIYVRCPDRPGFGRGTLRIGTLKKLAGIIRKRRIRYLYFESLHLWNILLMRMCPGCVRIEAIHDVIPHDGSRLVTLCTRAACAAADCVALRSRRFQKALAEKYGISPEKITYLEPWRHFGGKKPLTHSGEFLYFGRIRKYKGLDCLERIIRRTPSVRYRIVGEPDRESLPVVDRLRGCPNVKVTAREVSDREMEECFRRADWLVLPYTTATQSGVIADACRMSRPVIAFAVGAVEEQVKNGETGFLIPAGDEDGFVRAVERAAAMTHREADAFSEQAYVFGCSRYAAVAAAGSFLEMLRRAGERKGI